MYLKIIKYNIHIFSQNNMKLIGYLKDACLLYQKRGEEKKKVNVKVKRETKKSLSLYNILF